MSILWKFVIWIKSLSKVGSETLLFYLRRTTVKTLEKNLLKEEFDPLKTLLKNKDIIVQKADKGKTVVILNRKDCVCKMKNILNDK